MLSADSKLKNNHRENSWEWNPQANQREITGNEGEYGVVIIGRDRMGDTRQKERKEVISNVKKQFLLPSVRG